MNTQVQKQTGIRLPENLIIQLKKKARISFRVNPNVDAHTHKYITTGKEGNKFGIRYEDAFDIYMKAFNIIKYYK